MVAGKGQEGTTVRGMASEARLPWFEVQLSVLQTVIVMMMMIIIITLAS